MRTYAMPTTTPCAGPLTNLKQSMVQLARPRRLFDSGSFGLGGALTTRFRPVERAGERWDDDGPSGGGGPPPSSSGAGGGGGGGAREEAYDRSLPASANPYAITAPAPAAGARGSGARQAAAASAAAAAAADGPVSQASQAAFATQAQSQHAMTQSFTGLSQGSTYAVPGDLDFGRTQQSQAASQQQHDAYFK